MEFLVCSTAVTIIYLQDRPEALEFVDHTLLRCWIGAGPAALSPTSSRPLAKSRTLRPCRAVAPERSYVYDRVKYWRSRHHLTRKRLFREEMTTLNRTRANRLNAKKSTGPRTGHGRTRASLNRLLHGLRASTPVLPGENPSDLMELTESVAVDVQPQGVVEEFMAERVALGMWRLRRAERAEFGVLAGRLLEVEKERALRLQERCEIDAFEQLMVRGLDHRRGRAPGSDGAAGRDRIR
jgi:hypothetical protein